MKKFFLVVCGVIIILLLLFGVCGIGYLAIKEPSKYVPLFGIIIVVISWSVNHNNSLKKEWQNHLMKEQIILYKEFMEAMYDVNDDKVDNLKKVIYKMALFATPELIKLINKFTDETTKDVNFNTDELHREHIKNACDTMLREMRTELKISNENIQADMLGNMFLSAFTKENSK